MLQTNENCKNRKSVYECVCNKIKQHYINQKAYNKTNKLKSA